MYCVNVKYYQIECRIKVHVGFNGFPLTNYFFWLIFIKLILFKINIMNKKIFEYYFEKGGINLKDFYFILNSFVIWYVIEN